MKKKENISKTDKENWEEYIRNPKDVFDKEGEILKNYPDNSNVKFDLHGYSLNEANSKVREIIFDCHKKKIKEIFLITGKGMHSNTNQDVYRSKELSKLRYSIPDYIKSNLEISEKVSAITSPEKERGGEGVLVIKLKNL